MASKSILAHASEPEFGPLDCGPAYAELGTVLLGRGTSTTIHMGCYAQIDDRFGMARFLRPSFSSLGHSPKRMGKGLFPDIIKNQPWNFVIGADILRTKCYTK